MLQVKCGCMQLPTLCKYELRLCWLVAKDYCGI